MKKKKKWFTKEAITAYIMLAPLMILLLIFVIIPLIYAFVVSFYQWSFYQDSIFIGFENFRRVLVDKNFWGSIWTGIKFALMTIPAQFILAFLFAHVIKYISKNISSFVKISIYIPYVVSGVVASLIFMLIYNFNGGILNAIVTAIGFEKIAWLQNITTALTAIGIPAVWLGFGFTTLIMLAGLNDIPNSYYEAADIDGANFFQKMGHITIPLMKNIFVYVLITGLNGAIQQFDLPYMMTGGGPLNTTTTPNLLIYNHFQTDPYLGYTIAAALILFIIIGSITLTLFVTTDAMDAYK